MKLYLPPDTTIHELVTKLVNSYWSLTQFMCWEKSLIGYCYAPLHGMV